MFQSRTVRDLPPLPQASLEAADADLRLHNVLMSSADVLQHLRPFINFLSVLGSTTKLSTLSDSNDEDEDDEDEGNYVNVHDGMQTD